LNLGEVEKPLNDYRPEYGLALLSITALIASSLELEFLEHFDGMLLYMTLREIAWDGSVALLVLCGMALAWWFCVAVLARITERSPKIRRHSRAILWRMGLLVPLTYFALDLFDAFRLRFRPHWHPGLSGWAWLAPLLLFICAAAIRRPTLQVLQSFCRSRLAPIGLLHLVFALLALIALCAHRVYLFQDYVNPTKATTVLGRPDVYLITMDALRADDMSLYSYRRQTTPNLDRLAKRASTFDYFFANSNFTTPSTTSIETGKLPWTHRVFQLGGFLRDSSRNQTLASLLRQQGYYTASISSNCYASPLQHKTQASYDAIEFPLPENGSRVWTRFSNIVGLNTLHTLSGPLLKSLTGVRSYLDAILWSDSYPSPAEAVFYRARTLLASQDITQPHFVWMHILPPHDPYLPPAEYRGRFLSTDKLAHIYSFIGLQNDGKPPGVSVYDLQASYDETVAYADQTVGDFISWLDRTGRLDRSIVIVSSDHGESFEHGWLKHTGPNLYNGLIRVPLLIHLPGQNDGARITQAGEQVDLLPTVLDLLGVPAPAWAEGTSLKPALEGKPLAQRLIFSMNFEKNSQFTRIKEGTVAVIDPDYKYIRRLGTGDAELYRYRTDPVEQQNLIRAESDVAISLEYQLSRKLAEINAQP
jgi:arylsulfatase A-like enzyme